MPESNHINGPSSTTSINSNNTEKDTTAVGRWSYRKVEMWKKESTSALRRGTDFRPKSRKTKVIETLNQIKLPSWSEKGMFKKYHELNDDDIKGIDGSLGGRTSENLSGVLNDRNKKAEYLETLELKYEALTSKVEKFKIERSDIVDVYKKIDSRFKYKWSSGDTIWIPIPANKSGSEYQVTSNSSRVNKKKIRELLSNNGVEKIYNSHLEEKEKLENVKLEIASVKKELNAYNQNALGLYTQERRAAFDHHKIGLTKTHAKVVSNLEDFRFKSLGSYNDFFARKIQEGEASISSLTTRSNNSDKVYKDAKKEKSKLKMSRLQKMKTNLAEKAIKDNSDYFDRALSNNKYKDAAQQLESTKNRHKDSYLEAKASKKKSKREINANASEIQRIEWGLYNLRNEITQRKSDLIRTIDIRKHWCHTYLQEAIKSAGQCVKKDIDNFKKVLEGSSTKEFTPSQPPFAFTKEKLVDLINMGESFQQYVDAEKPENISAGDSNDPVEETSSSKLQIYENLYPLYDNVEGSDFQDTIPLDVPEAGQTVSNVDSNDPVEETSNSELQNYGNWYPQFDNVEGSDFQDTIPLDVPEAGQTVSNTRSYDPNSPEVASDGSGASLRKSVMEELRSRLPKEAPDDSDKLISDDELKELISKCQEQKGYVKFVKLMSGTDKSGIYKVATADDRAFLMSSETYHANSKSLWNRV